MIFCASEELRIEVIIVKQANECEYGFGSNGHEDAYHVIRYFRVASASKFDKRQYGGSRCLSVQQAPP